MDVHGDHLSSSSSSEHGSVLILVLKPLGRSMGEGGGARHKHGSVITVVHKPLGTSS